MTFNISQSFKIKQQRGKRMKSVLLLILTTFMSLGFSKEKDVDKEKIFSGLWIEPGIGISNIDISGSIILVVQFKKKYEIAIARARHTEFKLKLGGPDENELFDEYNLLFGRNKNIGWSYLYVRGGLGYVNGRVRESFTKVDECKTQRGDHRCDYLFESISSFVIPVELGISFGKVIGVGLKLHAALGPKTRTAGLQLILPIGLFNI